MKVLVQPLAAGAAIGQALQHDVGGQRIIARAHRRVAEHPVAGGEMSGVGSNAAHTANGTRPEDHRQIELVLPFAA